MLSAKQSIFVMALLLFSTSAGIAVNGQSEDIRTDITGLTIPFIDGLIDKEAPIGSLGEWDDGLKETVELKSSTGSIQGDFFIKHVSDRILIGLLVESVSLNFEEIKVTYDVDGDGEVSPYDIRMVVAPTDSKTSIDLGNLLFQIEMFDGQSWSPMEKMLEMKPEEADAIKTQAFQIGTLKTATPQKVMGMIVNQQETTFTYSIETSMDMRIIANAINKQNANYESPFIFPKEVAKSGVSLTAKIDKKIYGYPEVGQTDNPRLQVFDIQQLIANSFLFNSGISSIEVTQAVQFEDNSLSLVKNKQTMARVFVTHEASSPVDVEVTLTATAIETTTIFGIQFPVAFHTLGSLSQSFSAPVSPDRDNLEDSANFILPDTWTAEDNLKLTAHVKRVGFIDINSVDNTKQTTVSFTETKNLNIYFVRLNTGTDTSPTRPTLTQVNPQLTEIAEAYPVARVNFIELDWDTVGVVAGLDDHGIIDELNDLYGQLVIASIFALLFGIDDVPFPHQLYGFRTGGGGHSDPTWNNHGAKLGFVGVGGIGSMIAAHEINHNFGPNSWGRHVADTGYGCNAPGPDATWQTLYSDDDIHALGWSPTWGLLPSTTPDFMSYCSGPSTPTAWISDYRWERMITEFKLSGDQDFALMLAERGVNIHQSIKELKGSETSRIISGTVDSEGQLQVDPSFEVPGALHIVPEADPNVEANFTALVSFSNQSQIKIPIYAHFSGAGEYFNPEHAEPLKTTSFSFFIPDNGEIVSVEYLDQNGKTVYAQKGTGVVPSVELSVPQEIKRGGGNQVVWDFSAKNTTNFYFKLQYAHNNRSWTDVGPVTTGSSIVSNFERYPGSKEGQFRLLASDGFQTSIFYPSLKTFMSFLPPELNVTREKESDEKMFRLPNRGSSISFSASAVDPEDGLLKPSAISWELIDPHKVSHFFTGTDFVSFRALKSGHYILMVTAKDSSGLTTTKTVEFNIAEPQQITAETLKEFREAQAALIPTDDPTATETTSTGTTATRTNETKSEELTRETTPSVTLPIPFMAVIASVAIIPIARRKRKS